MVDAPSLEKVKVQLGRSLSHLVQWKMSLPLAGGWADDIQVSNTTQTIPWLCDLSNCSAEEYFNA